MEEQSQHPDRNTQEVEFSFLAMTTTLFQGRKRLLRFLLVALVFGLIWAFLFNPDRYRSSAVILPISETPDVGGASKLLKQFKGLGGFSLGDQGGDRIPPDLYPNITSSTPFLLYLADQEVPFSTLDVSPLKVYDYYADYKDQGLGGTLRSWTIGLPNKIKSWFKSDDGGVAPQDSLQEGPVALTESQLEIMEMIRSSVSVELDEVAGIIRVAVEMPDPHAAAAITQLTLDYLTDYSIRYKTEKEKDNLNFVTERLEEAKNRFHEAQEALAVFRDRNQSMVSAMAATEKERLEAEYNLTFNIYNTLAQQLEEARIKVQEKTPVFKVLEPVMVPVMKSSLRKRSIIVISLVLGLISGVLWILYGAYVTRFIRIVRGKEA